MIKNKVKKKKYKKTILGLAFKPSKDIPYFKSVYSWVKKGSPDGVFIYDHVDTLLECNIQVCDAINVNGMFVKTKLQKPTERVIEINPLFVSPRKKLKIKSTENKILVAENRQKQKMAYQ